MWGLRVNALAKKEFIDWCRSFGGQLRVPVWAAHELQRHLIDDSVQETIKKRSSACERQFNDFFFVTAHPLYKPLKLNNSFRANCSGMMPLSLLAAAIRIACS